MQNRVFVFDRNKKPLSPCHPARARQLLKSGRATVYRRYPFTIILKDRQGGEVQPTRLKIDPGARTTGLALVLLGQKGQKVIWAAELQHRSDVIRRKLLTRRQLRRARRNRKTRYRKPRFLNRRRPEGWLPPSLQHRVETTLTWVRRIMRYASVTALSVELAKFDTQKMQHAEISGVEYQQGELQGYDVREYLLEKFGRRCAYCKVENVPLEIEHIRPRTRGGSNRVSNLVLSCKPCNRAKGNLTAEEFGHPEVEAQARKPLKDAAVVNATRWTLYRRLMETGLPVEVGTGARTKYNRRSWSYPKAHWIDAACVGESGNEVRLQPDAQVLVLKAVGHGKRQRCGTDKHGFPIRHAPKSKQFLGFRTGDVVEANVPGGKYAGRHIGRVVIRHRPSFRLKGFDVHPRYLRIAHRADGYAYSFLEGGCADSPPA